MAKTAEILLPCEVYNPLTGRCNLPDLVKQTWAENGSGSRYPLKIKLIEGITNSQDLDRFLKNNLYPRSDFRGKPNRNGYTCACCRPTNSPDKTRLYAEKADNCCGKGLALVIRESLAEISEKYSPKELAVNWGDICQITSLAIPKQVAKTEQAEITAEVVTKATTSQIEEAPHITFKQQRALARQAKEEAKKTAHILFSQQTRGKVEESEPEKKPIETDRVLVLSYDSATGMITGAKLRRLDEGKWAVTEEEAGYYPHELGPVVSTWGPQEITGAIKLGENNFKYSTGELRFQEIMNAATKSQKP